MTMDIIHIYIYRHPGVHRIWKFEKTHYKNGNGVKKLVFFTSGLLYNYIQVCVYVYIYICIKHIYIYPTILNTYIYPTIGRTYRWIFGYG